MEPMNIFLFKDGIVRLASQPYDITKDYSDVYTHLTNYSLNKNSKNFDEGSHKLRLSDCLKGIMTQPPTRKGKPAARRSANDIWTDIEAIVIKTIITV
jgi:hypothetical protein